jgi:hypothetical protein
MNLCSDSIQSMEKLQRKSKKVKRGATLGAEIDGALLTAYAKIARGCRADKDLGVSRYCSAARTNVVLLVVSTITVV